MRVWDAELLNQKPDGYADGLFLWVDGIENTRHGRDTTSAKWEDLSGNGHDLTIYGNATMTDIAYRFDKTYYMLSDSIGTVKGTYEVVYQNLGGLVTSYAVVHTPLENRYQKGRCAANTSTSKKINPNINIADSITDPTDAFLGTMSTLTITDPPLSVFINGNSVPLTGSASSACDGYGNKLIVGARYLSGIMQNFFDGCIASIRIYERVLTAEEILHNYRIDKKRFGSGVFV